jgi:hypothetical protein
LLYPNYPKFLPHFYNSGLILFTIPFSHTNNCIFASIEINGLVQLSNNDMLNIKRLFILFCIAFISLQSNAQVNPIKQFSEDPIKFLDDIKTMLEATNLDKKDVKHYLEKFTLVWNSPKYNDKLKKATYDCCNLMVKRKLRILPEYKSYLSSVMNFVNSDQTEDNFSTWQECINKILNGKALKNYSDYLEMSENLFESNTFYKSAVIEYSSNSNKYYFEYDTVPLVIFPKFNLKIMNNQGDSGLVFQTRGVYYPYRGLFQGEGGTVNWKRVGFDEKQVYAELKKYQITLKTSGFTADSVTFYNKNYFANPLKGVLTEKVISEKGSNISYPRFESYSKRMKIQNIAKDVDYDGGFTQRGEKFLGSGNKEEDAKLVFYREGKKFLIVGAKLIGITEEKLTAESANIKFYLDKDSITHPSVNFKFMRKDRNLSLVRTNAGISKSPFINTFHKVDMYFEELNWKIDDPKIDLKMLVGNSSEDGMFESSNYFRGDRYDRLQGIDPMNPLIQVRDFVKNKNNNVRTFYGDEFARFLKLSPNDVRPNLIRLSILGFLTYDAEDDEVSVHDKLFDYIAMKAGKLDYDVIQFPSEVRASENATINLLNYDMIISGVKAVSMSDSQNVVIYPIGQKLTLKKNRDFVFGGVVHAGRFDFFGKEFAFNYDKFIIDMKDVDSMRMMVKSREPDAYGNYPLVKVKTVVEHVNGNIEIDNPMNKSGRKPYPSYPILNSFKDSYAYYNKKQIQNGKYPKDKFYFHLEPFQLDSLDNFSNEGLVFKGEMVTADIFPKFKETLALQKDYSMGFITQTPPNGYPMYGGKGTYTAAIKLSNQGLRGDGTLNYVTSTSKSNDFIFYPDSTKAIVQTFDLKEQKTKPEFPQVHGDDSRILWHPYKDVLNAWNDRDKKFQTMNGQATINGRLSVTPVQLFGFGIADFINAKLEARLFKFKSLIIDSDTANFSLKSADVAALAFSTNNVNAHVDFAKRMGEFKSNGKGSIVKFPINQYICFMDKFKWFMDASEIELGADKANTNAGGTADLDLEGPEFISVHPKQDSLRFQSPRAKYDLKKYVISAMEVKYINVADARIYPDKGDVVIEKDAYMRPLLNSKIIANAVTQYHKLYNCTVNVTARKNYNGSGYYDYVDELKNKQTFYFSNISVDTTFQTYAETEIKDTSKFQLSPYFEYRGKVKLKATAQYLVFDGAARIVHTCPYIPKVWIKFEAEVNPNSIAIPVSKTPVDLANKPIASSFMITTDSTHFYTAFLSPRHSTNDAFVLPADGFLVYDKAAKEYRISNKEKLVERSLPGNYMSLSTENCTVYGEGKVDLGADFGQLKIESFGSINHLLIPDSTAFDLFMTLDFFFNENSIDKMADDINLFPELKPTEFSRPVYEKSLRELLGKEQADKLITQVNLGGSFKKMPDELRKTLVITDLKMKWNKETRSFTSIGQIGVGNIYKTQINKFVNGKIEIAKKRGGDIINIYLELDEKNWYYFNYTRGTMLAVSSNEAFNTYIKEMKQDKREKAGDKDKKEPNYYFNICPPSKKTQFVRKTQSAD